PIGNAVRSHIAQTCAELAAERLTAAELTELERALAALEAAIARQDLAAAKSAHDAFHGLFLAGARNPLLVAMFNQAQVARLSNVSPEHKSFYDPRHLAHHRALLRALRKRESPAASAVVRGHFQSLGLMLEFVTRSLRTPAASTGVVASASLARRGAQRTRYARGRSGWICSCARNGTSGCAPIFTMRGKSSAISASRWSGGSWNLSAKAGASFMYCAR